MRRISLALLLCIGVFGCTGGDGGEQYAINLKTGQKKVLEKGDKPDGDGWVTCSSEDDCPDPVPCHVLSDDECTAREECKLEEADNGDDTPITHCASVEPVCDEPTTNSKCYGLNAIEECKAHGDECYINPAAPGPDGAELYVPVCLPICPEPVPDCNVDDPRACEVLDEASCTERCDCYPVYGESYPEAFLGCFPRDLHGGAPCEGDDCACADVPACELECPPGTHNPVDDNGCVLTCKCEPDGRE